MKSQNTKESAEHASTDTASVHTDSVLSANEALYKYRLDSMSIAQHTAVDVESVRQGNDIPVAGVIAVFIPIIAIVGGLWVGYRAIEAKRAVRLALIERGLDASLLTEPINENSRKYAALRYGLLLCGLGLGLIVGLVVTRAVDMNGDEAAWITMACAAMFAGLGMVTYHLTVKRLDKPANS